MTTPLNAGNRKYLIFLHSLYTLASLDLIFGVISAVMTGTAVLPFDGLVFLSIVGIVITGNGVEHITEKVGIKITGSKDKEA